MHLRVWTFLSPATCHLSVISLPSTFCYLSNQLFIYHVSLSIYLIIYLFIYPSINYLSISLSSVYLPTY